MLSRYTLFTLLKYNLKLSVYLCLSRRRTCVLVLAGVVSTAVYLCVCLFVRGAENDRRENAGREKS